MATTSQSHRTTTKDKEATTISYIPTEQLNELLQLPDTELRSKLEDLLPYRPETLFLALATYPGCGEVHVMSARADLDGEVLAAYPDDDAPDGARQQYAPPGLPNVHETRRIYTPAIGDAG